MARMSSYEIPPREATDDEKLGVLREQWSQSVAFLQNQRAFLDFDKAIDIISGTEEDDVPEGLSDIKFNKIKRQSRERIATLSNLRPLWGFRTDNEDLLQQNQVLNKMMLGWYHSTFADRGIRSSLQYMDVLGTGALVPKWERDFWTMGRGDIALSAYGPRDILPIQMPKDHNLQKAYAVTIRTEMPIVLAWNMWPLQRDKIVPDREQPSGLRKAVSKISKFFSPVFTLGAPGKNKENEEAVFPTVDIFETYIIDLSVNRTEKPIMMGQPGTSWYYEVPFIGQDLATGIIDPKTGSELTRKATDEDCLLYPLRRLIQSTNTGVLYDDTSYWWHGMAPVVLFKSDDWAWEYLAFSIVRDLASLQKSETSALRAIDDALNARLRPPLGYDETAVSQTFMERFDPRQPGQTVPMNLAFNADLIKPIIPYQFYDVPPWITEHLKANEERMDYLAAVRDIAALAKARQIPASESIEKIMELAGPILTDMSRGMERSMCQLGMMWKGLAFQFYNARRRVEVIGQDGITKEDYLYEPGNMTPSHLPGEDRTRPSAFNQVQRAKYYMNCFFFQITPNSLHQITQTSRRLQYLQLQKSGSPIDPWTIAEIFDIPQFGPPPKGTTTVMERWVAWQRMQMEFKVELQKELGAQGAGGGQPGRPASNVAPAKIVQKDGGTRSTMATSR